MIGLFLDDWMIGDWIFGFLDDWIDFWMIGLAHFWTQRLIG